MHEWVVAPLAAALALRHAWRALGGARACGELGALVLYGFALEWLAIAVFASHAYARAWSLAPFGVPVAVAAVWAAVISSCLTVAARLVPRRGPVRAAAAALVGVTLDLLIEPAATRTALWAWTPPGPWLGVPIGNSVGWAVIIGTYALGADRVSARGGHFGDVARRALLVLGCLLALVAVGLLWTRLSLESLFRGAAGWAAVSLVLVMTAAAAFAPRRMRTGGGPLPGEPSLTVPEMLARTPGRAPEAVLLLVALTFAADAATTGETPVILAAAAALSVVFAVSAASGRASSG